MSDDENVKNGGKSKVSTIFCKYDTINISMTLVKATSLEQFREHGKARMHMPYWTFTTDGAAVFHFVHQKTDGEELAQLIGEGKVWIEEKYSSFGEWTEDEGNGKYKI